MHEDMPDRWRMITGTDPSWMPRVIRILQRDNLSAWDQAISKAVSENAAELEARNA